MTCPPPVELFPDHLLDLVIVGEPARVALGLGRPVAPPTGEDRPLSAPGAPDRTIGRAGGRLVALDGILGQKERALRMLRAP